MQPANSALLSETTATRADFSLGVRVRWSSDPHRLQGPLICLFRCSTGVGYQQCCAPPLRLCMAIYRRAISFARSNAMQRHHVGRREGVLTARRSPAGGCLSCMCLAPTCYQSKVNSEDAIILDRQEQPEHGPQRPLSVWKVNSLQLGAAGTINVAPPGTNCS